MSQPQRVKRPVLERDRPIRDRSGLFGTATERSPLPGRRSGAPDRSDPVAQAVDTGYRVIEEYMRQGENAARLVGGGQPPDTRRMVVDTQDQITQLTHLFSDMAGLWLQLVQDMVSRTVSQPTESARSFQRGIRPEQVEEPQSSPTPSPGFVAAVNVVLQSTLPVTGHVDLHPQYLDSKLQVHDLRGTAAEIPRISNVTFEPAQGTTPARVRVRIPDDQPSGRYNAVLVEEQTGHLAGTLSVVVTQENGG